MGAGADRDAAWADFLAVWETLLDETARPGTVVVVEGERDRRALQRLGITGRVVPLHHGRRLGSVARELAESAGRVILLTDWDTEGGHLAQRLREFLDAGGPTVDSEIRRRLALALRGEVVHVEGLAGWARRMAQKQGASLDHFLPAGSESLPAAGPAGRLRE